MLVDLGVVVFGCCFFSCCFSSRGKGKIRGMKGKNMPGRAEMLRCGCSSWFFASK